MSNLFIEVKNATATKLADIPLLSYDAFKNALIDTTKDDARHILSLFAKQNPISAETQFNLYAVIGDKANHSLLVTSTGIGYEYPSLSNDLSEVSWFEREIAEQYGIVPQGHPWLKPIRFHRSWHIGHDAWNRNENDPIDPCVTDYFTMDGEETHEVAVGPVHAGVIEPGHFRFQCMGEDVYHLEISLGYQHRGVEKLLMNGPSLASQHILETTAGDSSIAHTLNYTSIIEALAIEKATVDSSSATLKAVLLELERIANHVGDLGALAGDVAYLPTMSYCGRIRGEYLNMTAELAGNRFGRNILLPFGSRLGMTVPQAEKILAWAKTVKADLDNALELLFEEPSALDRFENTGIVPTEAAKGIGLTGSAGRASGIANDARCDYPLPALGDCYAKHEAISNPTGDVHSRALIRYKELEASHKLIFELLEKFITNGKALEATPKYLTTLPQLDTDSMVIAVTEAWRGELIHVGITDENGKFARYKIVDPSFRNWFGLAYALRNEQISNFPICNKSFNLSYCGTDL